MDNDQNYLENEVLSKDKKSGDYRTYLIVASVISFLILIIVGILLFNYLKKDEKADEDISVTTTQTTNITTTQTTIIEDHSETANVGSKIIMFHNGKGPMCIEALDFLDSIDYEIEQHLNYEDDFQDLLSEYMNLYQSSEGVSDSFSYYPIIFIKDRAFSGFDDDIENELLDLIETD